MSQWTERRSREYLMEAYWYEGKPRSEIADELGISTGGVQTWLDKRDVPTRSMRDSKRLEHGKVTLAELRDEYGIDELDDEPVVEWTKIL